MLGKQHCVLDVLTFLRANNINTDTLDDEDETNAIKELVEKQVQRMIRATKLPEDYDTEALYGDVLQYLKVQDSKVSDGNTFCYKHTPSRHPMSEQRCYGVVLTL